MIPVGDYRPDLPDFQNPGATRALNVLPSATSYRPLSGLVAYSNALAGRCQGAFATRDSSANVFNFAGDANHLYRLDGTSWTDVTRASGGAYITSADGGWSFTQFGDLVIAVNGVDAPQSWTLGSATRFTPLAGDPPFGRFVSTVRDFVVIGRISGFPNRVQWSGINNAETWSPSAATQADYQTLPDGGWVQGLVGGEYGTVFQERSIKRMTYIGAPLIFQFDEIARNRGVVAEGSIANFETTAFFLDNDGFHALIGGQQLQPIGDQKVDKTFWRTVDQGYLHRISAAIDPINKLYIVSYPGSGNIGGTPNRLLIYNWTADRWSEAEIEIDLIYPSLSETSYTLDSLDSVSSSLDALGFSLDSRTWTGGLVLLSAFEAGRRLALFTGPALPATVETGEAQLFPGRRAMVSSVRPIIEGALSTGAGPSVRLGVRNRTMDAVVWGPAAGVDIHGECPARSAGRYHRARISLPAGAEWQHIQGIDLVAKPEGRR